MHSVLAQRYDNPAALSPDSASGVSPPDSGLDLKRAGLSGTCNCDGRVKVVSRPAALGGRAASRDQPPAETQPPPALRSIDIRWVFVAISDVVNEEACAVRDTIEEAAI
jgi:hypothetical protein